MKNKPNLSESIVTAEQAVKASKALTKALQMGVVKAEQAKP